MYGMSIKQFLSCAVLVSLAIQPVVFGETAKVATETRQSIKKREAELSALCGKIKKKMSPAEWAEFQKAQQAWVAFRDLEVGFYENNLIRFNASQNIALFLRDELTGARIKQLQELLESWNG